MLFVVIWDLVMVVVIVFCNGIFFFGGWVMNFDVLILLFIWVMIFFVVFVLEFGLEFFIVVFNCCCDIELVVGLVLFWEMGLVLCVDIVGGGVDREVVIVVIFLKLLVYDGWVKLVLVFVFWRVLVVGKVIKNKY